MHKILTKFLKLMKKHKPIVIKFIKFMEQNNKKPFKNKGFLLQKFTLGFVLKIFFTNVIIKLTYKFCKLTRTKLKDKSKQKILFI